MHESTCVPIEAVAILQPVTALCLRDRHYWMNFKLILKVPFAWKSPTPQQFYIFSRPAQWKPMEISVLLSRSLKNAKCVSMPHYIVSSHLVIQLLRTKSHFALPHKSKFPHICKVCMYLFLVCVPSFPNYHSSILQGPRREKSCRHFTFIWYGCILFRKWELAFNFWRIQEEFKENKWSSIIFQGSIFPILTI